MADTANSDNLVFGLGNPIRRCPVTGRAFESGSGALPDEQQTANFIRERAAAEASAQGQIRMTELCEQSTTGPSCFGEALDEEYRRIRRRLMIFNFRIHLSKYPADLVRYWWNHERCLPWPTSQLAFKAYKSGMKPGRLFKGPPHWPKLRVIEGGKSCSA